MMRRRGRGSAGKSSLDWLPSSEEITSDSSETAAYRLAVLLINKQLKRGEWTDDLTAAENAIRETCLSTGVDKVWHQIGEKTALLAQFIGFPVAKKKAKSKKKVSLEVAKIDVFDNEQLGQAISQLSVLCGEAAQQIAIQKIQSQISSRRSIEAGESLLSLTGDASAISVMLAIASGLDSEKALKELSKSDKQLAAQFKDLVDLVNGKVNDWKNSINGGDDAASGKSDEAADALVTYSLDNAIDIDNLYQLVSQLNSTAVEEWLKTQLNVLDEGALVYIAQHEISSLDLKNECFKMLQDSGGEAWEESSVAAIAVFAQKLELRRLSKILTNNDLAPMSHPHETLLSYHLLATNQEHQLWEKSIEMRQLALNSIHSTALPEYLSPMSQSLVMLMEGNKIDDEHFTVLGKKGYQALRQARNALKQGGTGITSRTHINHLITSVEKADLSALESNLLMALISTLKLNQATISLQHGDADEEIFATLNSLVIGSEIPTRFIRAIRQLVFEYDIGLEQLVTWYQQNDPLSPWHTLSRAALFAQNNEELNAAREYRRAAESEEYDYEHSMILYRKSIIHLAHAEQWSEAVELLDTKPALRTAITKRFQLYLKVSFTASNQKTNEATHLLKEFVRYSKDIEEENVEGEMETKTITFFAEDELDTLRNYPFEHSRELPGDPFLGRVTAALNAIQRNKRRNRHSFDNRFRNEMQQTPPTIMAIYDIASDAAEKNPIEGLTYLERAQNSGKFKQSEMKTLYDAERALFATHKLQIPNSSRRYLKNLALPPLVVVDTNILVDALVDKIAHNLELASETSLDLFEHDNFHKVLKSRADAGRINLWLPSTVKQELIELSKRHGKLKAKFSTSLVKPEVLESVLDDSKISKLVDEIISEYSRWKPLDIHTERDAVDEQSDKQISLFLAEFSEIYDELTDMKVRRDPKQNRTKINGQAIFPEAADREIMAICRYLASQSLEGLGSILVATRDGDFTLAARAFEERFGYGIIKNSKMLNSWLN